MKVTPTISQVLSVTRVVRVLWFIFVVFIVTLLLMWLKAPHQNCESCIVSDLDVNPPTVTPVTEGECILSGVRSFTNLLMSTADDAAASPSRSFPLIDTGLPPPPGPPVFQPAFLNNQVRGIDIGEDGSIYLGVSGQYNPIGPVLFPQNLVPSSNYSGIYKLSFQLSTSNIFGSPLALAGDETPTINYIVVIDPITQEGMEDWVVTRLISLSDGKILVSFTNGTNIQIISRFLEDGRNPILPASGMDPDFNAGGTPGYIMTQAGDVLCMRITSTHIIVAGNDGGDLFFSSYTLEGVFVSTYSKTQFTTDPPVAITNSSITGMVVKMPEEGGITSTIFACGLATLIGVNPATTSVLVNSSGIFSINPEYTTDEFIIEDAANTYNPPDIVHLSTDKLVLTVSINTGLDVIFVGVLNNGVLNPDFGVDGMVVHAFTTVISSTYLSLVEESESAKESFITGGYTDGNYYLLGYTLDGKNLLNIQRDVNPQGSVEAGQFVENIFSAAYRDGSYVMGGELLMGDQLYGNTEDTTPLVNTQGLAMTFLCG